MRPQVWKAVVRETPRYLKQSLTLDTSVEAFQANITKIKALCSGVKKVFSFLFFSL